MIYMTFWKMIWPHCYFSAALCDPCVLITDLLIVQRINPSIKSLHFGEDVFAYIRREKGSFDQTLYRQILGAANEFKEGDETLNIAAHDEDSRSHARQLIANTSIKNFNEHIVYTDELLELIQRSVKPNPELENWTVQELKDFTLSESEEKIKEIMPSLSSNPLPNSKIGSKGYMGARVQPNSPTDNIEDISWQVFNAWSYGVGDVVLGTNPVSSDPESVANIEKALYDIIASFELEETIPNCVLSHVDIQAEVEEKYPGTTGIWFQSIAGTVEANNSKTRD